MAIADVILSMIRSGSPIGERDENANPAMPHIAFLGSPWRTSSESHGEFRDAGGVLPPANQTGAEPFGSILGSAGRTVESQFLIIGFRVGLPLLGDLKVAETFATVGYHPLEFVETEETGARATLVNLLNSTLASDVMSESSHHNRRVRIARRQRVEGEQAQVAAQIAAMGGHIPRRIPQ